MAEGQLPASSLQALGANDRDFWIKIEDLIMRKKNDYSLYDMTRVILIYSQINQGSEIFWREIEEYFLVKSA